MSKEYGSRTERRLREAVQHNNKQDEELISDKRTTIEEEKDEAKGGVIKRTPRAELEHQSEHFKIDSWLSYFLTAGFGLIFSFTFYSFPLTNNFATPLQSEYLYSGFAMNQGLTPYNDFFGAGGPLFYLLNYLGNFTGSSIILYFIELIALIASGILTYRLVARQTFSSTAGLIIVGFTMAIVAGLGRGGASPTLLAFPFAVWAVDFLDTYFHEDEKDGKFVVFGLFAAIVFMISPMMSIFFIVSAVALLVFNLLHLKIGRGIYQFLSVLFGLLVIIYSVSFYTLNDQTIYTSLEQSVLIPLTQFGMTGDVLLTIAKVIVLVLVFGIVTGFVHGIVQIKEASNATIWYLMLLVGAVLVGLLVFIAPEFDSTNLLAIVPFLMVFQGRSLVSAIDDKRSLLLAYLQNKLFAPILAVIFVFASPFVYHWMNQTTFSSEKAVVQYVQENTTTDDHVYVVSEDKNINLLSERTATIDNVPSYYPKKFKQTYDLNVANLKDKLVIIQAGQKVPSSLSATLSKNYKSIGSNTGEFTIYQLK